jgi:putative transposase
VRSCPIPTDPAKDRPLLLRPAMSRPPRIELYDYTGVQRYFLTICTHQRDQHFKHAAAVSLVLDVVLAKAREHDFAAIAYCAMPDHLHLLVGGESDNADLRIFMKTVKQHSGFRFKQAHGTKLWQDGFHDHVLRGEERTEAVIY